MEIVETWSRFLDMGQYPGGGGYSDISHVRRLGLFLGGQNSEFQYFWGFSKKKNFFWGGGGGGL